MPDQPPDNTRLKELSEAYEEALLAVQEQQDRKYEKWFQTGRMNG